MDLDHLKTQLIEDEGLKLLPYRDTVGKLTIGVGRNLDNVGITKNEAMTLLDNDIARVQGQLISNIPWWNNIDSVRQEVLMNMAFNMGVNGLMQFKDTLQEVMTHQYDAAAQAMRDSKWYGQVGARAVRLAAMMETGEYAAT